MIDWLLNTRWRIIATGILIATVPLVSLTAFVSFNLIDHLVAQSNEKRKIIASAAAQILETKLDSEIAFGSAYATRPYLIASIAKLDRPEMALHLKNLVETSTTIERAFIASPAGILLQDYPSDPSVIGKNFSDRDWYRGVSKFWAPYVSEFYLRQAAPQRLLFAIAIPIKNSGQVTGILVMQPKADFVRMAISTFEAASGDIYVVDRHGRLIYHSRHPDGKAMNDLATVPVVAKVLKGLSGTEKGISPQTGVEVNAAYCHLKKYGWGLISERPLKDVLQPAHSHVRLLAILAGIMLLLAGAAAYRWADMFSSSRALSLRMKKEEAFDKAHAAILTLLNRQMDSLEELGWLVLARLAELTDTNAAILYECHDGRLLPCRALAAPLPAAADALADESLRQRQTIRVTDIPPETMLRLSTGVGEFLPREILAIPLMFKAEPVGVLEIASLHSFPDADLRLIDRIAPQIGIAINTIRDSQARRVLTEQLSRSNEELLALNSEFQAMNDELRAQRLELDQSNRRLLEVSRAKSEFLANMSHELRTPLNSVIGFSEVLRDQLFGPLNDRQAEYVGHVLTSGQHLLSLINDILDLSKVESGKMTLEPSRFPLKELLESSLVILREKALKHNIAMTIDLAPEADLEVVADCRKLKQILYNLLSNAVKFTPDGGAVTMAARKPPTSGETVEHEHLEISVTDTGIGIREEEMAKLFQPFSQLDSSYDKKHDGTGLGLALTKHLVSLHGGVIRVESRPGEGSRFIFTLPLSPGQPQPETTPPPLSHSVPPDARILLIEDDHLARTAMESALATHGYRISTAANGTDGIAAALAAPPDLIILDLIMPGMNGFEVAKRLRAAQATWDVPVMVLTAMRLSPEERLDLGREVWRIVEKGSLSTRDFAELVASSICSSRKPEGKIETGEIR